MVILIKRYKRIEDKLKNILDHPVFIVVMGNFTIFLLAVPYYYKFNYFSLLKIFLIVFLFILFYSIPFLIEDIIFHKYLKDLKNPKLEFQFKNIIPTTYALLLFLIIYHGVYTLTDFPLLSVIYSLGVIFISSIFAKCKSKSWGELTPISKILSKLSKNMDNIIFTIGIISFVLLLLTYNAIPITNYTVRMNISSDPLRLISTGGLVYGGINNIYYFALAFILIFLLGYNAGILILCFSFLIYNYRSKKISYKWLISSIIGLLVFLAIMTKIILQYSGQRWSIGIFEILPYRAYFDIMVLERIINYPHLMLGKITLNPVGESLIGKLLFNYSHNITSTMFGPIYLDFGIFGLIFASLLGFSSKLIYNGDKKIYSIYAAILLSMCEIGINYGFIIVMLVMLYVNSLIDRGIENNKNISISQYKIKN